MLKGVLAHSERAAEYSSLHWSKPPLRRRQSSYVVLAVATGSVGFLVLGSMEMGGGSSGFLAGDAWVSVLKHLPLHSLPWTMVAEGW